MSTLIYNKISDIMADIDAIGKGRTNSHQNYKFRGIEDLYNQLKPVLTKHRVFCAPEVVKEQFFEHPGKDNKVSFRSILTIKHVFFTTDGSSVAVTTVGEGIDTSDKATNKAMSAAMKYAFIELFSIPTEDIADSDRDHIEPSGWAMKSHQPTDEDGVPNPNQEYRVSFGQWKMRSIPEILRQFPHSQIEKYLDTLEKYIKEGKYPENKAAFQDFIERMSDALAALENGGTENVSQ